MVFGFYQWVNPPGCDQRCKAKGILGAPTLGNRAMSVPFGRKTELATATEPIASARVLLVDDDDLVRETMAEMLECLGFQVVVASCGFEAVVLMEAGEHVDVLVSDLSMPGIDGVETIKRVRKVHPDLPCILLTGSPGDREMLDGGRMFVLLLKPTSGDVLAAQIEAALGAG